jgi:hypothetical protein
MNPQERSSKIPEEPSAPNPCPPENGGLNGAIEGHGYWPVDWAQPRKLTPEEWESVRTLWTEEDERLAAVGLQEIRDGKGVSSEEFLRMVEEVAKDDG